MAGHGPSAAEQAANRKLQQQLAQQRQQLQQERQKIAQRRLAALRRLRSGPRAGNGGGSLLNLLGGGSTSDTSTLLG